MGDSPLPALTAQAENGTWSSGVFVSAIHAGFAGKSFVDPSNAVGAYAEVTLTVPTTGDYRLRFRYANATPVDRPARLSINDVMAPTPRSFPPTGAWTTWQDVVVQQTLQAGLNTIRISATTSAGLANYDSLTASGAQ